MFLRSEFVLGASVDVADETCTIGILHSDLNERLPSTLLFQVGEIWKQIKSLHHKCNEPIRPTQASIYQCVPKQKPYLYRESREMFEVKQDQMLSVSYFDLHFSYRI